MVIELFTEIPTVLYQNRYCNQKDFDLIVSESKRNKGGKYERNVHKVSYGSSMNDGLLVYSSSSYDVTLTSDLNIWILCNPDRSRKTVDLKIPNEKNDYKYNLVPLPDERLWFSACPFLKHLYVFGGSDDVTLKTCIKYDTTTSKWTNIAEMNICRESGSSTVFEGKIVVSGGQNDTDLKSVEAYDHHENQWTQLPDMIHERYGHGVVSMGNKMFVIGGWQNVADCEVFDSSSRIFTSIKKMFLVNELDVEPRSVFGIGGKITVFIKRANSVVNKLIQTYDVLENKWYFEKDFIGDIDYVIRCSKLPVA